MATAVDNALTEHCCHPRHWVTVSLRPWHCFSPKHSNVCGRNFWDHLHFLTLQVGKRRLADRRCSWEFRVSLCILHSNLPHLSWGASMCTAASVPSPWPLADPKGALCHVAPSLPSFCVPTTQRPSVSQPPLHGDAVQILPKDCRPTLKPLLMGSDQVYKHSYRKLGCHCTHKPPHPAMHRLTQMLKNEGMWSLDQIKLEMPADDPVLSKVGVGMQIRDQNPL